MEESVAVQRRMWMSTLTELSRQISGRGDKEGEPWPQQQWFECFKILVYEIPKVEVSTKDDLIFFVPLAFCGKGVMTRRRTEEPPCFEDSVDWKSTVAMYVVMHTEYQCSMSIQKENTTVHGAACVALPHVSSDTVVFETQDLMPPLHLEHPSVDCAIVFYLKADMISSWIPKSLLSGGDAGETIVSCGKVTMGQLQSSKAGPSLAHSILHRVIPSTKRDTIVLELSDPMQTVVYTISMAKGLSADVIRLSTLHVVDLERFSTSLFQSLYRLCVLNN